MPVTVVIADDHALTNSGLETLLTGAGMQVLASAANGIEAIALIKQHTPVCAVLDLSMPGANGLEVFLEARRWSPKTRFAVVTGNPTPGLMRQMQKAGISGLFLKTEDPAIICKGIAEIAVGKTVYSPGIRQLLTDTADPDALSPRELEILQGIACGLSNAGMAEKLGVSPKTVDTHRTNLMRKMGVHSTATLLVKAMKSGLIDVTGPA